MRPTTLPDATTDELEELADLRRRRLVNRGILRGVLATLLAAIGFLGFKAAAHAFASGWLTTVGYKVEYHFDEQNRARGGSTSVKASGRYRSPTERVMNEDLRLLPRLHRVESLDLSNSYGLRDEDLAILDSLTDLESLNIDRSRQGPRLGTEARISDAALVSIRNLTRLRELNLGWQEITDEGLANLAGLNRLQSLDLRGTIATDACLDRLKALPALKALDLTGTKVTAEGVAEFEESRPGVKVLADHLPIMTPSKPRR